MFLDSEPRPISRARSHKRDPMSSGFFSSQRAVESPTDHRTTIRRKALPLHERTESQNNAGHQQRTSWLSADKSTVRLVKNTSSPSGTVRDTRKDGEDAPEFETEKEKNQDSNKDASALHRVSDARLAYPPTNQQQHTSRSDASSLRSATPIHAQFAKGNAAGPSLQWQNRRSGSRFSSTGDSSSFTLYREGDSVFGSNSDRTSERESGFSEFSTLRDTPTPHEQEYQAHLKDEDSAASQVRHSDVSLLESVQEASPER